MLKKTITYTDFNGTKQTEDFFFNLTKAELFKLEVTADGNSLHGYLKKIVEENSGKKIMDVFELILKSSYGVRSEDGKRFRKSDELYKEFSETEAYSEFFFELVTDAEKASEFVNGLIPSDIQARMTPEEMVAAKGGFNKKAEPDTLKTVATLPTEKEVVELSREELEARLKAMD